MSSSSSFLSDECKYFLAERRQRATQISTADEALEMSSRLNWLVNQLVRSSIYYEACRPGAAARPSDRRCVMFSTTRYEMRLNGPGAHDNNKSTQSNKLPTCATLFFFFVLFTSCPGNVSSFLPAKTSKQSDVSTSSCRTYLAKYRPLSGILNLSSFAFT